MKNYGGFNIKIRLMGIFLLAIMALSTVFAQGCFRTCEYIDPEAFQEQINKAFELSKEKEELQQQIDEQRNAIAALEQQKGNIENAIEVGNADITDAEGNISDLQDQNASNQNEVNNIDGQIAARQAEVDEAQKRLSEVENELSQVQERLDLVFSFGGAWCFDGDTLVLMADGSAKNIKDITAGEAVLAYDTATGTQVAADVVATASGEADCHYLINGNLKVVPPHPFLTAEGQWVAVENLQVGDVIKSNSGTTEIASIELIESGLQIFNICVEDYHNFYVSADGEDYYLVKEQ